MVEQQETQIVQSQFNLADSLPRFATRVLRTAIKFWQPDMGARDAFDAVNAVCDVAGAKGIVQIPTINPPAEESSVRLAMRDPQLSVGEQIAWVIPCSNGKYIMMSPEERFRYSRGDLDNAFCMARETDARTLFECLMVDGFSDIRDPERRIVPSHPPPSEAGQ